MQGKKIDVETKARVIEEKINNPDLSSRDIEEITWVDHTTITHILNKDFQQVSTESERIAAAIDRNDNLQVLADVWIDKLTKEWDVRVSELVSVKRVWWEQNQTMRWNASIIHWFKGDLSGKSGDELLMYIMWNRNKD